jgi:hypothetical protein
MANFFYFGENGRKHGPFNEQQLQKMAAQGKILPTTPLETDDGYKGVAGQIPGLQFNTAAPSPFTQAPPPSVNYHGIRNPKNKIVAALLALFLGHFGTHRFYLGDPKGGTFLFLFGLAISQIIISPFVNPLPLLFGLVLLFGIALWAFIDFICLLTMRDEDFDSKYNT